MADMDTVIIRDREGEFISATLGPEGHKLSRLELLRIIAKVKAEMGDASKRAPWNEYIIQRDVKDWIKDL